MRISIHGGAISKGTDHFNIGQKNIAAVRKCLKYYGLSIVNEDVGG